VTVVIRRPGPPLDGMVRAITYQAGEQPRTSVENILPGPGVVWDLDRSSSVDWAEVAARHGYADQPHLVEEFRQLVGVTPTAYLRSRLNGPNRLRFAGFR
jgi:AraC-like DNA-binding protein